MDDECEVKGLRETLLRNIGIGVISSTLSMLPVFLLKRTQRRHFVYHKDWNARARRRTVALWLALDVFLWIFALLYILVSLAFVLCFVVSVNEATEYAWLVSVVMVVAKKLVLVPLVLALALGGLSSAMLAPKTDADRAEISDNSLQKLVGVGSEQLRHAAAFRIQVLIRRRLEARRVRALIRSRPPFTKEVCHREESILEVLAEHRSDSCSALGTPEHSAVAEVVEWPVALRGYCCEPQSCNVGR